MWYAKRQTRRSQDRKDGANYLHLNQDHKLLLQTLVENIDQCETKSSQNTCASWEMDGTNNSRNFLEEYQRNVEANRNAERNVALPSQLCITPGNLKIIDLEPATESSN